MPREKVLHENNTSVETRIADALPNLTPAHRKMADYVLEHSFRAATMSIEEFAEATSVSTATANRFAHSLGFGGYPEFRASLVRGFESVLAPVEKMRVELTRKASSAEVMNAALADNLANLKAIQLALPPDTCEQIVTELLSAKRVFVVGFGASGYLSSILARNLELHCNHVQSLADIGGPAYGARTLLKLQERDVVMVIAFPRYARDTIIIARKARERGARIIALTDSPDSPIAPLADLALFVESSSRFGATSDSTVCVVIEALSAAVAHQTKNSIKTAATVSEFVLPWLHQDGRSE